jgi:hydroxymethylbilane synthase
MHADGHAGAGAQAPPTPERIGLACGWRAVDRLRAEAIAKELRGAWPNVVVDVRAVDAGSRTGPSMRGATPAPATFDRADDAASPGGRATSIAEVVRGALRSGEADIGLHAFPSLPLAPAPDLIVGAVPMRGDPRDALVSASGKVLAYLPAGSRIGADAPGRAAQLRRRRTDLAIVPVAGDDEARLQTVRDGLCDAGIVSAAALADLGLLDRITEYLDTDQLIPAPGQGGVALEVRLGDTTAAAIVAPLHDALSAFAINAERACLAGLRAADDVPVGVFAVTDGEYMFIHGIVATPDGSRAARLRWTGPWRDPVEVGGTLAELLLSAGAREIISGEDMPPTVNFAELRRQRMAEYWDAAEPSEDV